mmetsp:Transcript_47822/g.147755  ORF Transcript_47822/g.147755 Transcript_47822/m.147755 type:complete len:156 (+) Transcript_47822:100-567(+)
MGCLESSPQRPIYQPQPCQRPTAPAYSAGPYGPGGVQGYAPGSVVEGYAPGRPAAGCAGWACKACTMLNAAESWHCSACGTQRPGGSPVHGQQPFYAQPAYPQAPYAQPAYAPQGYAPQGHSQHTGMGDGMMVAGAGLAGFAGGMLMAEVLDDIF